MIHAGLRQDFPFKNFVWLSNTADSDDLDRLSIIDATPLAVCDNLRIARHRVFRHLAARGKTSTGWFYGFKVSANFAGM